ncbi:hypothetical protein [uncultured Legionella sp.]|uniref:hypothetical protein n=1 Tax=uncultured Legionella sp. TaxID=210934 RepID=UPI0026050AA9|nr:hypothetical protein [uncultured Legionella sp.]
MKLTPRQRYQILFVVIEEIQRLAQKFGLNDGLEALQIFRESAEIKKQGDLVTLLEEETEESKTKNLLSKTSKNNEDKLLRIMGEIFTIKMHSTSNELKQVINLTEKELKKLSKFSSGGLDSEALNDYVKVSIKNYIKLKFGVSRKDIREARTQLEKRWGEKSEKSLSATSSCARVSLLLLQDKKAQNFNYHGIKINGLYKLIKIVNGIENQEVARSFLPFFSEDSVEHRQIIRAFFAVEKTSQYCRLPTMLVQILSSLVANNPDYERLAERFVTNILKQPDKTSIDSLLNVPNAESTALLFHDLFESTLSISAQFNHILAVAKINLAEREPHIQALNSTQDIFLRSVYFFCFVSPLLELVETRLRLKRQDLWNIKDIQQLRLELSMAFHVLLGMNSNLGKITVSPNLLF